MFKWLRLEAFNQNHTGLLCRFSTISILNFTLSLIPWLKTVELGAGGSETVYALLRVDKVSATAP